MILSCGEPYLSDPFALKGFAVYGPCIQDVVIMSISDLLHCGIIVTRASEQKKPETFKSSVIWRAVFLHRFTQMYLNTLNVTQPCMRVIQSFVLVYFMDTWVALAQAVLTVRPLIESCFISSNRWPMLSNPINTVLISSAKRLPQYHARSGWTSIRQQQRCQLHSIPEEVMNAVSASEEELQQNRLRERNTGIEAKVTSKWVCQSCFSDSYVRMVVSRSSSCISKRISSISLECLSSPLSKGMSFDLSRMTQGAFSSSFAPLKYRTGRNGEKKKQLQKSMKCQRIVLRKQFWTFATPRLRSALSPWPTNSFIFLWNFSDCPPHTGVYPRFKSCDPAFEVVTCPWLAPSQNF